MRVHPDIKPTALAEASLGLLDQAIGRLRGEPEVKAA